MTDAVNRFFNSVDGATSLSQSSLIELFVYFLTIEQDHGGATPKHVTACFAACDLTQPKNVAARLSEGTKTKPPKFISVGGRYRLERRLRQDLEQRVGKKRIAAQTRSTLRDLEQSLPQGSARDFLTETIDCFEIGAKRATIVMAWILAMDHVYSHIMNHRLTAFNGALANNTDKSVKVKVIAHRDDLSDIRESKLIELCRAARIISNDVRKILDQKLGTRNSYAHPSGIAISHAKVSDFVEDLVRNVVLKYPA